MVFLSRERNGLFCLRARSEVWVHDSDLGESEKTWVYQWVRPVQQSQYLKIQCMWLYPVGAAKVSWRGPGEEDRSLWFYA